MIKVDNNKRVEIIKVYNETIQDESSVYKKLLASLNIIYYCLKYMILSLIPLFIIFMFVTMYAFFYYKGGLAPLDDYLVAEKICRILFAWFVCLVIISVILAI